MVIELYRSGVGIMLLNTERRILMGKRIGVESRAWQMPQGGIDECEDPQSAAVRELLEEVGTDKIEILGVSKSWLRYDLPGNMAATSWNGKYKGQRQKWFAMMFTGLDSDINLYTSGHPEFEEWAWMEPEKCLQEIIDFKKLLYRSVFKEFAKFLSS